MSAVTIDTEEVSRFNLMDRGHSTSPCVFASANLSLKSVHAALKDAKNAMTEEELDAKLEELQRQVCSSSTVQTRNLICSCLHETDYRSGECIQRLHLTISAAFC